MSKSPAQLEAEIADALRARKSNFGTLISRIEKAVDAHPELTRERHGGKKGAEEAELTFRHGEWIARCGCRNRLAKGRGEYGDSIALDRALSSGRVVRRGPKLYRIE